MKILRVVVASVLVAALAACGGQEAKPAAAPTTKAPEKPNIKVLYTHFSTEKAVDLVAEISNPSDKTRVGVRTTWKAYDAEGIIVGSYSTKRPPIPPGSSILYYGHSNDLSGVADSVKVTIANDGSLRTRSPRPTVKLSKGEFSRGSYDVYDDSSTWEVTAIVTALTDVAGEDVKVAAILRDESGDVVGAGVAGGPQLLEGFGQDLPEMIEKGERVRIAIDAQVGEGTPASVQLVMA